MTQANNTDAWSALQAQSVEATDSPIGTMLAYDSGEAVGFDHRMTMPSMCIKCARSDGLVTEHLKLTLRRSRMGRNHRLHLRFPMCPPCRTRNKRASYWMFAAGAYPLVILLLLGLVANASGLLALAYFAGWVAMGIKAYLTYTKERIEVDSVDSDGFVRVTGLHHEVRAAIVHAAGATAST